MSSELGPQKVLRVMAACLGFGRQASIDVWADGPISLARVAIAAGESPPSPPQLHRRGPLVVAADMRLPASPEDASAHDALFGGIAAGTFPEALDGDFALAIWNGSRRELTLARDRLGIRPLYLARTGTGGLAFASFPDAFIDAGIVDGDFDPAVLPDLVRSKGAVSARTWIKGVERVPPGHVVTIGPDGRRVRRYWRYPLDRRSEVPDDHALAAKALRSELESAVSRALPARGPLCTHLSGGLDSGAVVALCGRLAEVPAKDITAYCVTMPESDRRLGALDEEPTARAVAGLAGVTLTTFPFDMVEDGLLQPLARTFLTNDNPESGYVHILRDAAARGADSILCGFGGDEVVSYGGDGTLLPDLLALRWGAVRQTARELRGPLWRALVRQAARDLLPPRLEQLLRRAAGKGNPANSLAERAFRRGFRPSARAWTTRIGPAPRQRAHLEFHAFHHRLESQAWEAAQHGLRYVFPLLDWRLVEFGAGLPAHLQLRGGLHRALFRTALADLLPPEILARRNKLNPAPTALYRLALNRAALIEEARRVAASPAASRVIDLNEVERQLAALPESETIAEAIRAQAAQGLQLHDPRVAVIIPFRLARALAQNEAECARRAASRPRAA